MNALVDIPARIKQSKPTGLFLCTQIDRDGEELEVVVYFEIGSYSPGSPAVMYQRNGDPGWPAEPAEFEFEFASAELDGFHANEPPLTEAEIETLRAWFLTQSDEAEEKATDYMADREMDRADYLYDRYRDEQMERGL